MGIVFEFMGWLILAAWYYTPAKVYKRWSRRGLALYLLCCGLAYLILTVVVYLWMTGSPDSFDWLGWSALLALVPFFILGGVVNLVVWGVLGIVDRLRERSLGQGEAVGAVHEPRGVSGRRTPSVTPNGQGAQPEPSDPAVEAEAIPSEPKGDVRKEDEGDGPAECAVCRAWNPPGSGYCGECGAALDGVEP